MRSGLHVVDPMDAQAEPAIRTGVPSAETRPEARMAGLSRSTCDTVASLEMGSREIRRVEEMEGAS